MKVVKELVYNVLEVRDCGSDPIIARFSTQKEAEKLLPLIDGYGGRIQIETVEIIVFDSFEEYLESKRGNLRKSAIGKLSKQERFALGLE